MGSTANRLDDDGNEKIQCQICSKWWHRIDVHVFKQHGMTADAYRTKFPGAQLRSAYAQTLDSKKTSAADGIPEGHFGIGRAVLKVHDKPTAELLDMVPSSDPNWILDANDQEGFAALAVAMQDDENTMIVGPAGIGKTTMVLELAARCNRPVLHLNGWGEIRTADIRGTKSLIVDEKTGQSITAFEDSEFIRAAEAGHWVLVDEFDSLPPHITFLFHPVLERRRRMLVQGRPEPRVRFHPDFRFIATANTLGYGDDSGMYAGTNVMNQALLDRFGTVVRMDYPSKATERSILVNLGIPPSIAEKMLEVAIGARQAVANHSAIATISTRRLVNWANKSKRLGDVVAGAEFTVVAKAPKSDEVFLSGIIQRHFGSKTAV